jgi:hypothetical protein
MYSTERHDVCVGAGGRLTGVDDAALTAVEVKAPPEPELDEWLGLLPPHALSSAAATTGSAIRRIAATHPLVAAIVRWTARRLGTRPR